MTPLPATLSTLVEDAIRADHGCDECYQSADAFAEMRLAGTSAAEAMPLVEAHLAMCPGCRDEFEALLGALRAEAARDAAAPAGAPARRWWSRRTR